MTIKRNVSLKPFNTFGILAIAEYYTRIEKIADLKTLLTTPTYQQASKIILGGGSNVLFTQDFKGLLLHNALKGIEKIKETVEHVWVKAYSGEVWHDLVLYCVEHNWGGIENLSLIPGSVGAAPIQNIGAYGVELKDIFSELEAFDLKTGEIHSFNTNDCEFDYRESIFKKAFKGHYFVLSVTLKLDKIPQYKLDYGVIRQQLETMKVDVLTIKEVSNAICIIRQKKLPNPKNIGNAGSFFKNPIVSQSFFESLLKQYPTIPHYRIGTQTVKIPAGWLIEKCGWKGKKIGQTGAYKNQALVLVNYGSATGKEIAILANEIQNSVNEKFNIQLNQEVNII